MSALEMTWQPIETAPKDGSLVLINNALGNIHIGRWANTIHGDGEAWRGESRLLIARPTHWMPLPEPSKPPEAAA